MNAGEMASRVLERLDEIEPGAAAANAIYYGGPGEVLDALNEGQRTFALLTLCLQVDSQLALAPSIAFYHARATFDDWLLPLRVTLPSCARVRPARLEELDALDSSWQAATDTAPKRYAALGFDFLAVYPQLASGSLSLTVTYARSPVKMVSLTDVPEIPAQYHPGLVDYGINRLRMKEGGGEFAKTMVYFERFLDGAQKHGNFIRSRNAGARYDKQPFELERFDRSKLLKLRMDLVPGRGVQ
jgi:hypothetical protein